MKKYTTIFFTVFIIMLVIFSTVNYSFAAKPRSSPKSTPTKTPTLTPTYSPIRTLTPTNMPQVTSVPNPTSVPTTTSKKILGYTTYYYEGDKSSYNSMVTNTSSLTEIATATHTTDGLGNITGLVPTYQISYANQNGIKPYVMLANNFDGNIAKTLLESSTNRQNLINNLIQIMKTNNYKGVNVDLEGVYYTNRNQYTTLIGEIASAIKPLGYSLALSLPAKTSDNPTNSWNGAYDYASLSNYADYILIMAYDEHYPGGDPGPVASINWVSNVVKYCQTVIPKEKIYLGLAAYGYDWSAGTTKSYSINGCYDLAKNNNATILWDDTAKSSYFTYTDTAGATHTVWFENAQSISYKLNLVNSSNLGGIGIWRLGIENSDYWSTINATLN